MLGTAGLTSVAGDRSSRAVVDTCLEHGLRSFDTAPLYGLGTAEALLGLALAQTKEQVFVTTKVGIARPSWSRSRAYARLLKRSLSRAIVNELLPKAQFMSFADERLPRGCFRSEEIERSLDLSLCRLKRSSIDTILLHEAYPDNTDAAIWQEMRRLRSSGKFHQFGAANGCCAGTAFAGFLPSDGIQQGAMPPETFTLKSLDLGGASRLHSIIKSFQTACSRYPEVEAATAAVLRAHRTQLGTSTDGRAVIAFVLAREIAPAATLIFATSKSERASVFLRAIGMFDQRAARCEIRSTFEFALRANCHRPTS